MAEPIRAALQVIAVLSWIAFFTAEMAYVSDQRQIVRFNLDRDIEASAATGDVVYLPVGTFSITHDGFLIPEKHQHRWTP